MLSNKFKKDVKSTGFTITGLILLGYMLRSLLSSPDFQSLPPEVRKEKLAVKREMDSLLTKTRHEFKAGTVGDVRKMMNQAENLLSELEDVPGEDSIKVAFEQTERFTNIIFKAEDLLLSLVKKMREEIKFVKEYKSFKPGTEDTWRTNLAYWLVKEVEEIDEYIYNIEDKELKKAALEWRKNYISQWILVFNSWIEDLSLIQVDLKNEYLAQLIYFIMTERGKWE